MWPKFNRNSASWNFVVLNQLFSYRPIFDRILDTHERTKVLQSAKSAQDRRILAKDYKILSSISGLIRYTRIFLWFSQLLTYMFIVRNLFYLYVMHVEFEIFSEESRLTIDKNRTSYSYGCIKSNCSSLLDPKLNATRSELTIKQLPIFSLCYPKLTHYYEPFQHAFGSGSMFYASSNLYLLMADLLVFRLQSKLTSDNSMLVFLVAPYLAYKIMLDRARQHMREIRHSYSNYLESERIRRYRRIGMAAKQDRSGILVGCSHSHARSVILNHPTITLSDMIRCKFDHVDEDQFASDCLPLIRSNWWHKILGTTISQMILPALAFFLNIIFVFSYFAFKLDDKMKEETFDLKSKMTLDNCSIWREDNKSELFNSTAVNLGQNIWTIVLLHLSCFFPPYFWFMASFGSLFFSAWELRCWTCELRYKLTMVRPIIRDMFHWPTHEDNQQETVRVYSRELTTMEPELVFRIDRFRAQFVDETRPIMFFILNKSFVKFSKQAENEHRLEDNYFRAWYPNNSYHDDPEGKLAQLLEKFYIELRLMKELRDDVEQKISLVTILAIVVNYLNSSLAIYIIRMTGEFSFAPLTALIIGQMSPLMLIINSVSMNTQMTKLNPLLRSILADLGLATSHRLKHMRSLYFKLGVDFDTTTSSMGGGLFRIHFTYGTMIQILIAVATIFLFALKA